jgi:hypothetical protein
MRTLPVTALALAVAVVLLAVQVARVAAGDADPTGPWLFGWVIVVAMILFAGLLLDGVRLGNRAQEWDGLVATPAMRFERATSIYFATAGWESQRDEPDYKVFVRRHGGVNPLMVILLAILGVIPALIYLAFAARRGQTVVAIEIVPVMGGTRVRVEQSRGESSADQFLRQLDDLRVHDLDYLQRDLTGIGSRGKRDPYDDRWDGAPEPGEGRAPWDHVPATTVATRRRRRVAVDRTWREDERR